ncbi:MAG: AAA family ATPase, partial [Spirulinaceae cyanobacterium]
VTPYQVIQEKDSHWTTISSNQAKYQSDLKQYLEQVGIKDTSDAQIIELASMEESELSVKLNNSNKAKPLFDKIQTLNADFKSNLIRSNSFHKFLTERIENSGKVLCLYMSEEDFHKNYFSPIDSVSAFQQSFARLFTAYEKIRVDNEIRELRNKHKGHNVTFISEQDFIKQNGNPPWEFVNDIFETANLDFRIDKPDGYNEKPYQPKLIHRISNNLMDFSDLSSGEKILVSFALCLYYAEDKKQIVNYPKVLLLDEIDAPLHPSMTQSILKIIREILVDKHNIKVILTTHSPSTVALSPESSIYVMTKDRDERIKKTSKDEALAVLTAGIPTLSIDYDNRRQVFVESKYDTKYYELIYRKINQHLVPEISLNFISSGTNGENCEQVKSVVKQLVDCGNRKVYGIIDWDTKNVGDAHIKVLGEKKRYSIENYIFDPILLITFLLREKLVTREELNLKDNFIYTDILKLDNAELQLLID